MLFVVFRISLQKILYNFFDSSISSSQQLSLSQRQQPWPASWKSSDSERKVLSLCRRFLPIANLNIAA